MGPVVSVFARYRYARALLCLFQEAEVCRGEHIHLGYPPTPWFEENAQRMLRILDHTAQRLERKLGLSLPEGAICYVTSPEVAEEIGASGRHRLS